MESERKEIDLSGVDIHAFELKRDRGDATSAEFAVEGVAHGLDEAVVEEIMVANQVRPESITLTLEGTASDE
jgi:hypothetical protein